MTEEDVGGVIGTILIQAARRESFVLTPIDRQDGTVTIMTPDGSLFDLTVCAIERSKCHD